MGDRGEDHGGVTLRGLRQRAELSQETVATSVGVSQVTVSGWESGRFGVPAERRSSLRQLLGCTKQELDAAIENSGNEYSSAVDTRLGEQIRARRAELGMSRESLADVTDVTAGAVRLWEQGANLPTVGRLEALAGNLGTDARALLASAAWSDGEISDYLDGEPRADTSVAALLRESRISAGLTQTQVADALGLSQNGVSAIETAIYLPSVEQLTEFASFIGIDPDEASIAMRATRQDQGEFPEITSSWPLDPAEFPRDQWFRQLRAHLGVSRAELAEMLDVSGRAIWDAERPDNPLPMALRQEDVLRRLGTLAHSEEAAFRLAWQPEDAEGIEHLVGLPVHQQVIRADRFEQILRARLLTGLTQTMIADAAGTSRQAAGYWIKGSSVPALGKLDGIAQLLGVEEEQLRALRYRTKHPEKASP